MPSNPQLHDVPGTPRRCVDSHCIALQAHSALTPRYTGSYPTATARSTPLFQLASPDTCGAPSARTVPRRRPCTHKRRASWRSQLVPRRSPAQLNQYGAMSAMPNRQRTPLHADTIVERVRTHWAYCECQRADTTQLKIPQLTLRHPGSEEQRRW